MRKLSFEYAFTDSLEIPDGATEHEIDDLISKKIKEMSSKIREEVKYKNSYIIFHDSENDRKENDKREEKQKKTIGIKNISPVNYDGPRL